jgi:hypothetical protein
MAQSLLHLSEDRLFTPESCCRGLVDSTPMMSISHWGMFDAKIVPYEYFPLFWANDLDTEFQDA